MKKRRPMYVYVVSCMTTEEELSMTVFREELPAMSWAERAMAADCVKGVSVDRREVLEAVPGHAEAH